MLCAAWIFPAAVLPEEPLIPGIKPGDPVEKGFALIRAERIIAHARVLSDQSFRGRKAGKSGNRNAADYITGIFREIGLKPGGSAGSYFQSFKIERGYDISADLHVSIGKKKMDGLVRGKDFVALRIPGGMAKVESDIVLAGYGITLDDGSFDEYSKVPVKGKTVLIFSGHPWSDTGTEQKKKTAGYSDCGSLEYKAENACRHGAVMVFVADNPVGWRKQVGVRERLRTPDTEILRNIPIPVLQITRETAGNLCSMTEEELRDFAAGIQSTGKPQSFGLRARRLSFEAEISGRARMGRNIIGIIPGTDEKMKDEAVVIGAHYDHLGEGEDYIYFGANDNAAGVGVLLEIARALRTHGIQHRRTVICIAFDAEEIGRRGSKHYLERPVISVEKTVLMINHDMIGKNEVNGIQVIGTSTGTGLEGTVLRANSAVGLELIPSPFLRLGLSDHSPFYYRHIPIIYLFGGLDDDYNTPRDTWDRLIPEKTEKVARLSFLTAWITANAEERPLFADSQNSSAGKKTEKAETPAGDPSQPGMK